MSGVGRLSTGGGGGTSLGGSSAGSSCASSGIELCSSAGLATLGCPGVGVAACGSGGGLVPSRPSLLGMTGATTGNCGVPMSPPDCPVCCAAMGTCCWYMSYWC